MVSPWDRNTILTELVSNFFDMEEGVIHLAKLLIRFPIVCSCPRGLFYPLVTVLALIIRVISG